VGASGDLARGQLVHAVVTGSEGVDLVARQDGAPW
jgi:hypothetical protein